MPHRLPRLTVLSGLSGAGKSVALRTLEDLGCYCVDNLPSDLLPDFVRNVLDGNNPPQWLAVGIDVRNRPEDLSHLPLALATVGEMGIDHQLVFLDTSDEALLKRYADTRRRHPLSRQGLPLADAISEERRLLKPLVALADRVLDTSDLNVHQLRHLIVAELASDASPGLSILLESFAYRRGVPADADFVFDARCLPNPHWVPALKPLSGRDAEVVAWLRQTADVDSYFASMSRLLDDFLPRFEADDRSYLTVAIGCTGGRHRSVYLVERLAEHFRNAGRDGVLVFHRELA